jgi:tRNA threonylcarbamoyladenosine biosynthesis protein TsaE
MFLKTEEATEEQGRLLYTRLLPGMVVYLEGDLGVGKTTLVRGCLQAAGWDKEVKSPTYTLVEEYTLPTPSGESCCYYHWDLYRLEDARELALFGFYDYIRKDAIQLIEWPQKALKALPKADLRGMLSIQRAEGVLGRLLQWESV